MKTALTALALLALAGCDSASPTTSPATAPVELQPLPIPTVDTTFDPYLPPLQPVCQERVLEHEHNKQAHLLLVNRIPFVDSTEGLHMRFIKGDLDRMNFYDHVAYLLSVHREFLEHLRCDGLPESLALSVQDEF